jgi:hypothetical protein
MKILLVLSTISGLVAFSLAAACGDDDDEAEASEDASDAAGGDVTPNDTDTDADDEGDVATPPELVLEQDGTTLTGSLGNYQWADVVADAFAIISAAEPSALKPGVVTVTAADKPFDGGTLTVFDADSVRNETTPEGDVLRWTPTESGLQTIEIAPDGQADLSSLEPGEYLLSFFGNWDDLGYAEYGFYVVVA